SAPGTPTASLELAAPMASMAPGPATAWLAPEQMRESMHQGEPMASLLRATLTASLAPGPAMAEVFTAAAEWASTHREALPSLPTGTSVSARLLPQSRWTSSKAGEAALLL